MDRAGNFAAAEQTLLGSSGQLYPDSMPARFHEHELTDSAHDHCRKFGFASTGRWCFEDMLEQPAPRLFSTHTRAQNLPSSLLEGQGRLIVISRNPKDAIVSAHFFSEKLAALAGNGASRAEVAPPSMQNTCNVWNASHSEQPEDGAYGDYYSWHREQTALLSKLGEGRAMITFYETLQASQSPHSASPDCYAAMMCWCACFVPQDNFDNEIRRLADFLEIELPVEKLSALKERVHFDAMAERGYGVAIRQSFCRARCIRVGS